MVWYSGEGLLLKMFQKEEKKKKSNQSASSTKKLCKNPRHGCNVNFIDINDIFQQVLMDMNKEK